MPDIAVARIQKHAVTLGNRCDPMPLDQQVRRTTAIANGKYRPKRNEPKVWFPSMASVAQVLSDDNQRLLRIIAETSPQSLSDLEAQTGRARSNLSRTLNTMSRYGLVTLEKKNRKLVPRAVATAFDIKAGDWGFRRLTEEKESVSN